jgi:hypothetical protein
MSIIKKINEQLSVPERKLKSILPKDYINKNIFRAALGIILLLVLFGAYQLDFDFKNYYTVSCKATEPTPCLNPFYYCLHQDELNIKDYTSIYVPTREIFVSNCDKLDMEEICKQGVCDSKEVMQGQTLGKQKPDINWINWTSLGILLVAFIINHAVWSIKKNGSQTDS